MPLTALHKADEGSSPGGSSSGNEVSHDSDFMEKWVHIGCEVLSARLLNKSFAA